MANTRIHLQSESPHHSERIVELVKSVSAVKTSLNFEIHLMSFAQSYGMCTKLLLTNDGFVDTNIEATQPGAAILTPMHVLKFAIAAAVSQDLADSGEPSHVDDE